MAAAERGTPPDARPASGTAASLRALAHKCRCLAVGGSTANVTAALNEIALDYERQALRVEKAETRAREGLAGRR